MSGRDWGGKPVRPYAVAVFFDRYGDSFYRLSEIFSDRSRLDTFSALETPAPAVA